MRRLIDTCIEADQPRKISPFDGLGLLELIVKTGIADAIAQQLGGLKGNRAAIAETIENNVRRKIITEHLTDGDPKGIPGLGAASTRVRAHDLLGCSLQRTHNLPVSRRDGAYPFVVPPAGKS
jgi:hypothetical protein